MSEDLTPEALADLEDQANQLAPKTFTDSEGKERTYKVRGEDRSDLSEDDEAAYRDWWEGQVQANASNHEQPIGNLSRLDYDSLG